LILWVLISLLFVSILIGGTVVLTTVPAEGVETTEQVEFLKAQGAPLLPGILLQPGAAAWETGGPDSLGSLYR